MFAEISDSGRDEGGASDWCDGDLPLVVRSMIKVALVNICHFITFMV